MPPAAEPPLAVWRGGRLAAALLREPGPIYGPMAGSPLVQHPFLRGRLHEAEGLRRVLAILAEAPDAGALVPLLEEAGYEVLPTPREALEWALR